jgi:hypothetical protein
MIAAAAAEARKMQIRSVIGTVVLIAIDARL